MQRLNLVILCALFCLALQGQSIQSPEEFLRTDYGTHFTPHYLLVDYIEYVAENSDRVTLIEYGETNEDRPLLLATISTPENLARIEKIRDQHLSKIGLGENNDSSAEEDFAIVWLSFGVHGNEPGGSESSMNILHKLADRSNTMTTEWLENTIVLFDPSLNPDGYNRYTHWVRGIGSDMPHPGLTDREHMEPWPSGRVNHYMFDLNRDWAWQTQVETQQRVKQYQTWMPHIHVDFHEMGYDEGYYFAPAAEPYHLHISDFQRDMQVDIGKNHAKYFDKEGWLYFTREIFDLLYPSYGDTWPTFNGAVGMTYEQAGHGMAGREISLSNGDTLTIQDRIDHHTQTALSTLEEASKQAKRLNDNFKSYFKKSIDQPLGDYKAYVIKDSPKARALKDLFDRNNIKYAIAGQSAKSGRGYSYKTGETASYSIAENDLVINANQPNGTLLQVLMEPEPTLADSVTYDITAWSLPHAYGVDAYGVKQYITAGSTTNMYPKKSDAICWENGELPYAVAFEWNSLDAAQKLSELYKHGVKARMAKKEVAFDDVTLGKGAIVVLRGDNNQVPDLFTKLGKILGNEAICMSTGFSKNGGDLGGSSFERLSSPKVLLLSGRQTSQYSVGEVWHYFDKKLKYPISIVDKDNLGRVDLNDFSTVILPEGFYSFSKSEMSDISSFVNGGGKLIAIGSALSNLTDQEGFALSKYASDDEKSAAEKERETQKAISRKDSYHDSERRGISNSIPGAIINNEVDGSHPLAFGLGDSYHSLKTSTQHYSLLKDAWNVVRVQDDYQSFGFIGNGVRSKFEDTFTVAVEEKGRGQVIYIVDNPLFRGFWYNGLMLFSNALFLVE